MVPKSFEQAFEQVSDLATRFADNEAAFLSPRYQEAEVRQDFLDKFFVALGWDVYHQEHPNPYEREVKIEKSVMVGDRGKRADYAFYTRPNFLQARFMAEAKKPARQLENPYDCFQAMRYGWNSNTPLAVLTDFEQFLILDSRYKPSVEKAANGIIDKFHYTQFLDEEAFRKIYYLFSREAVGDNSLEKFITGLKKAKSAKAAKVAPAVQIQPVGDTFLNELDVHRSELAQGFKRKNPELDGDELTEITQRTLDRLVFIRFLEDKLVEPSEIIDRLGVKSGSKWRDFASEVPRLNSIYNGIIFKPHSILDSPDFQPDEKAFADTLAWLSHKNSAYDFNTIPIHILGSIYERFLGKTIVVTDKRAKLEEKPEVRKAGGVYYTPEYIVRYIVENTIGKLIAGRTPEEISKMRFADIACGSGSFLLGIFDYLIKYHVDWYAGVQSASFSLSAAARKEQAKACTLNTRQTADGSLQLTLGFKRDILINNIFGVDLDAQAVEVAQLSLYLKLLEEETTATAQQYLAGFREQLLPNLNNNIVHGNSLIDYDIMDGQLFDAKDLKKLNPMSFQSTFPEVFSNGGFDAIVGNPPYGAELGNQQTDYLKRRYRTATYQIDSYPVFIERSSQLLKKAGRFGLIVPSAWVAAKFSVDLRMLLSNETSLNVIVVAPKKVFADATVETVILVAENDVPNNSAFLVERWDLEDKPAYSISRDMIEAINDFVFPIYSEPSKISLLKKIRSTAFKFAQIGEAVWGVKVYQKGKGLPKQSGYESESKIFHSPVSEKDTHRRLLGGSEVNRFSITWKGTYVDYGPWLAEPRSPDWFQGSRILIREVTNKGKIQAAITSDDFVFSNSVDGVRLRNLDSYSELYVLGLLNSSVISFVNSNSSANAFKDAFPKVLIKDLLDFPIRTIDFNSPTEKAMHDRMVGLVEKMIDAKKNLATARTDSDRTFYERLCTSLDNQIDDLVFQLYDITPEERKIIEGN